MGNKGAGIIFVSDLYNFRTGLRFLSMIFTWDLDFLSTALIISYAQKQQFCI